MDVKLLLNSYICITEDVVFILVVDRVILSHKEFSNCALKIKFFDSMTSFFFKIPNFKVSISIIEKFVFEVEELRVFQVLYFIFRSPIFNSYLYKLDKL